MPTQIKRYRNRKLYNPAVKRYITLNDVETLIRGGGEIVVTDSASGEDVTTHVLTQVIMGQENRGQGILSHSLLVELIKAQHDTLVAVKSLLQGSAEWERWLSSIGIPSRLDIEKLNLELDKLSQAIDAAGHKNESSGRK